MKKNIDHSAEIKPYEDKHRARQLVALKALAAAALSEYTQYEGYHDGAEWKLFIAKKNLRTGAGLTAVKGERLLGRLDEGDTRVLFFSPHTLIHTSFPLDHFEIDE